MAVRIKSEKDIEGLRRSGEILSRTLSLLKQEAKEGVTLRVLDMHTREILESFGAHPTFLGYTPEGGTKPYPASLCTSVNEVVVHGTPGDYILKSGDILKIDLGVTYEGYITDSATTVGIGSLSEKARRLMNAGEEALQRALQYCSPRYRLGDIGWAIESIAKRYRFKILKGLTGHGVGFNLHEDPVVYNYGERGTGMKLTPGLVLAIEPMISMSSEEIIQNKDDSYSTADKSLSVHFEHTIAITEGGYEILTSQS